MKYKGSKGFTLLEILVVVVMSGLITAIAASSFFYLLRGATSSQNQVEIKQNGDYALGVIERKIRNARSVDSSCTAAGFTATSLTLTNQNGTQTVFDCDSAVGRIRETINGVPNYLTNTSVTLGVTCDTSVLAFTCTSSGVDPGAKNISIAFTLEHINKLLSSQTATKQTFSTQINLRNR